MVYVVTVRLSRSDIILWRTADRAAADKYRAAVAPFWGVVWVQEEKHRAK